MYLTVSKTIPLVSYTLTSVYTSIKCTEWLQSVQKGLVFILRQLFKIWRTTQVISSKMSSVMNKVCMKIYLDDFTWYICLTNWISKVLSQVIKTPPKWLAHTLTIQFLKLPYTVVPAVFNMSDKCELYSMYVHDSI